MHSIRSLSVSRHVTQAWTGNESLKDDDPEMYNLIRREKRRQVEGLELIASEVYMFNINLSFFSACLLPYFTFQILLRIHVSCKEKRYVVKTSHTVSSR